MHKLKPAQVNACIALIQDKKLFANLSEEQIIQFDYSKIDHEIFNAIFSGNRSQFLENLVWEQLQSLFPFFLDEHWKIFGKKYAHTFDLDQVEESKRKAAFRSLFSTSGGCDSNAATHLHQLTLERIYELSPLFSESHWEHIGEVHTLNFDFDRVDSSIRKGVFKALFPPRGWPESRTAANLFPQLTLERIYELSPLFSESHWEHIGETHALNFDFAKIDAQRRQAVFNAVFSTSGGTYSTAAKYLSKLTLNRIYVLSPLFTDSHWQTIGTKHVCDFNFSKIEDVAVRTRAVKVIFDPKGGTYSQAAKLLPQLNPTQITDIKSLLDPAALKYLPK